jgi:hypothetical protein
VPVAPVLTAAATIAEALERAGFDYAIGGALALAHWGVPRATVDVDIGVSAEPLQLPELFAVLKGAGCELDDERAAEAAMHGDFGCRVHGVRIDVFLPILPLARQVLERRVRVPFGARPAWIVSAEDSALLKLLFGRTKDYADLERLFAVQGKRLDFDYIDRWASALFPPEDPRRTRYEALKALVLSGSG